jgi:ubiquinone biosynthesis protein Coq4
MSTRQKNEALEDRLINFTIAVNDFIESLPNTNLGVYLKNQLSRSSLSPSLNHGIVQASESTKDLNHKIGGVLKK